jgi:hypothetical protein
MRRQDGPKLLSASKQEDEFWYGQDRHFRMALQELARKVLSGKAAATA